MYIRATTLFDGKTKKRGQTIKIDGEKISEISKKTRLGYTKTGWVTPAFIDAHSHIGMARAGEPSDDNEGNDNLNHISPLNNPIDSIYFDDPSFSEAADWGVLYSCIVPGSGNLIGGQAKIIKNYAKHRGECLLRDYGYKMALGWNPRSPGVVKNWKGERPNSRMGAYALLRKKFDEILQKRNSAGVAKIKALRESAQKWEKNESMEKMERMKAEENTIKREYELKFSEEDRALLEILDNKKPVKVHVHKTDDVYFLIELKEKYNIKVTAEHAADVHDSETFNALAENNIPVVAGPLGALAYKVELKNEHYRNLKYLMQSKAEYGLMTDHPVILTPMLRDSLKFFMIQDGLSEREAISLITYKNAKILGIDDILGTIEPGKLASLIVWDRNPFDLAAFPKMVIAEGKIIRQF